MATNYVPFTVGSPVTPAALTAMSKRGILVFVNEIDRDAALSGVLEEHMHCYLTAARVYQRHNGSSWVTVGRPEYRDLVVLSADTSAPSTTPVTVFDMTATLPDAGTYLIRAHFGISGSDTGKAATAWGTSVTPTSADRNIRANYSADPQPGQALQRVQRLPSLNTLYGHAASTGWKLSVEEEVVITVPTSATIWPVISQLATDGTTPTVMTKGSWLTVTRVS